MRSAFSKTGALVLPVTRVLLNTGDCTLSETAANGDQGTAFPYAKSVKYACDEHRRSYSDADATAVADFVNASSWIERAR